MPEISVVVPTRDRPAALDACLAALDLQTAIDRLEIVVVDDGSSIADAVEHVVAAHPSARLVRHTAEGPAGARNAGARAARGTIICFTDDDCVPEREWAERMAAAIERGADAAAGTTLPGAGALAEAMELIVTAPAAAEPFAPSNNLACARQLIEAVPFDTAYPNAAGEDRDWCARIAAAGYSLHFENAARLQHRQTLTLRSFLGRQVRYGNAAYRFRSRHAGGRPEPPAFYVALLQRAFSKGFAVGVAVAVAQIATAIGFTRAWTTARIGES